MPVQTRPHVPRSVLREDNAGSADNAICYPGISSCVTVTGVSPTGLVGVHITIASDNGEINDLMTRLRDAGGNTCLRFYVMGPFTNFKPSSEATEFNTRKKMQQKIKSIVNKNASVKFYDAPANAEAHFFAELDGVNARFYKSNTAPNDISGYDYPDIANRTEIPQNRFVSRYSI